MINYPNVDNLIFKLLKNSFFVDCCRYFYKYTLNVNARKWVTTLNRYEHMAKFSNDFTMFIL